MKIVVNALQYKRNSTGIGVVVRELFGRYVSCSRRRSQVVLAADSPEFPAGADTEQIRAPWRHGQGLGRMYFQSFQLGRRYCREAVLLTTDSKTPFFLPGSCVLVPVVTDLAVYRLKGTYQATRVVWWRLQYQYVKRRAERYIAISEFTKRELVELLGVPAEKIEVVPCASPAWMGPVRSGDVLSALRRKYRLPERYILFVGNFNPRKNLERLLRAFDLAKGQGIPHHLVIAGEQGWKFDKARALEGVGCREAIHFIGYVPDEDMAALYTAAELFAFPSLYEGFGIPVLEAQACGTPVLTSRNSALPEVGGEGAEYVDPYDVEGICRGLLHVLEDPGVAEALREKGQQNARRYSWAASAERLGEIIEKAVQGR